MAEIGTTLWNFIISIGEVMYGVWTFLSTPITLADVSLFGFSLFEGITFTPILLTGAIVIAIVTVGLVSLFLPF